MVYNNVLEALGHTPLIRLNRIPDAQCAEVLVKYEAVNIGGSIKTRTAYNMIREAERRGDITKDTIIVEPTSGNQGIGLSLVGAVRGYTVRIIMPDSVSEERRKLCRAHGAEVILVHDKGNIGECIDECMKIASKMAQDDPNVYMPQQFINPDNPRCINCIRLKKFLKMLKVPSMAFAVGLAREVLSLELAKLSKKPILALKFGLLSPNMLPFYLVEKWERIFRWELEMV